MKPESTLDMGIVCYIVRKEIKTRGITQDNLSGGPLSPATISNILNQKENFSESKVYELLKRLDINEEQVVDKIEKERKIINDIEFDLEFIENLLEKEELDQAMEQLKLYQLERYHPLKPFELYLHGKYFYKQQEWTNAEDYFLKAVNLAKKYSINHRIISHCYNNLSSCSYYQNNLTQALRYVEMGLDLFKDTKNITEEWCLIMTNQIMYLLNSGQSNQAFELSNLVWASVSKITSIRNKLVLYKHRATLLSKNKRYQEAIDCCKEGIRIAQQNRIQNRNFDLLMVLGSVYLELKNLEKAEKYFHMALALDKEKEFIRKHMDAHTYLSILHFSKKNTKTANEHLTQAISIGQDSNDIYRLTKALIVQGNTYFNEKQYNQAISFYKEAYELAKKHNFKHRQFTALFKLVGCFVKLDMEFEYSIYSKELYFLQEQLQIKSEDEIYEIF